MLWMVRSFTLLVLAGIEILKKLEQVTILTSDPLKKVISQVEQYQAYLAYCQEPISPTKTNISPRILHPLKPGVLYR